MSEELNYPRQRHGQKRAEDRRKRMFGLLFFFTFIIFGSLLVWRFREKLFEDQPWAENVQKKVGHLKTTEPDELLSALRKKVSAIQDDLQNNATSEKLESHLKKLRKDIKELRDKETTDMHKNWQILLDKSDVLLENAREQKEKIPEELDEIKTIITKWESQRKEAIQRYKSEKKSESEVEQQEVLPSE